MDQKDTPTILQAVDPKYGAESCQCFQKISPDEPVRYGTHGIKEISVPGGARGYACERCHREYHPVPAPVLPPLPPDPEVIEKIRKEMEARMLEQGGEELLREYQKLNQENPDETDS